jgi:tetratricopeptide (TPR) repeat protein
VSSRTAPLCIALLLALQGCAPHRAARRQLEQGRLDDVLRAVRPVDAEAHVLRAQALRRKGRLRAARTELLLGRARDERSANVHLLLGFVELELRQEGAALRSLRRALALRPDQRCLRRAAGLLLLRRAAYREAVGPRPLSQGASKRDRDEALALDPCLERAALARLTPSHAVCPGAPGGLDHRRSLPAPRGRGCSVTRPAEQVRRLQRRELLLGCRGPRLALRLEAAGCVGAALSVWQRLASEAPGDPRWSIEAARAELALGRSARAEQLMQRYVHGAQDRAAALLDVAAVWLHAGSSRKAGRAAVDAIPFAQELEQHLTAIKVLRAAGQEDQARQLCKITLAASWPNVSRERLIDLVEQTLRSTP